VFDHDIVCYEPERRGSSEVASVATSDLQDMNLGFYKSMSEGKKSCASSILLLTSLLPY
jgi:hypothetical protein